MKTVTVTSPFNGKILKKLTLLNKAEIDKVLDIANERFLNENMKIEKYERVEILQKTIQIMKERENELTLLASSEGGKPYLDSKIEVQRAISSISFTISSMNFFKGEEIVMGNSKSSINRIAYTMQEPIGVVAAISAFNHPLNLAVHQIIPSLAVGCTVIIKPSLLTPLSAINFVEILYEAGLPKEWCQVVICDKKEAQYLATSSKINYLSFIGSSKVGWFLNSKVAVGTRVGLEHGGVAPVIVEPDADFSELIPAIAKGGFYHAGQVCVSVQKVFVNNLIIDKVSKELVNITKKLIVGDPLDIQTEVGPIITKEALEKIENLVNEAIDMGAKLLCGGKSISTTCYAPTILLNPPKEAKISNEEIFGPVICIYSYENIEDAFNSANSLDFSFQAAIFTKNIDIALKAIKRLDATAVIVNDHTAFRVDWMPFGGAKSSGLGTGGIIYSMKEMSREKLMVIKSSTL